MMVFPLEAKKLEIKKGKKQKQLQHKYRLLFPAELKCENKWKWNNNIKQKYTTSSHEINRKCFQWKDQERKWKKILFCYVRSIVLYLLACLTNSNNFWQFSVSTNNNFDILKLPIAANEQPLNIQIVRFTSFELNIPYTFSMQKKAKEKLCTEYKWPINNNERYHFSCIRCNGVYCECLRFPYTISIWIEMKWKKKEEIIFLSQTNDDRDQCEFEIVV